MNNSLTQDVIPISYKVKLNTDFENNIKLDGNAEINMNVINSTDVIILRAKNIIIKPNAHLKCDYPTIEPVISTIEPLDNITELFKIILSNKLEVGSNCNLTFNYTRDDATSSTFKTPLIGSICDETILASWNLACDVIPCPFDRTLKARFTISVEHSKHYIALSHMDAIKVELNSENPLRLITHFAESPEIYPIQFVLLLGNFIKDDHNENFQIFTTRKSPLSPNYVQEMGTKMMNTISNCTGVPYENLGLKKLKTIMGEFDSLYFFSLPYDGISNYGCALIDENYSRIHVLNRAQLIDDAFSLARAEQLDFEVVFSLLTYLKQESDPIPWAVAYQYLPIMCMFLKNTKNLAEKLEQKMLSGQLNDTVLIMTGTKDFLEWAKEIKPVLVDPESTKKLINWLDDPEKNPLSGKEGKSIMCDALKDASQELWDKVWDKYNITKDSQLIYPMLCTKNITISRQYLLRSLPNNASRDKIISTFKSLHFRDTKGMTVIVDYIIEHHNKTTDLRIFNKRRFNELKTLIEANKASIIQPDEKIKDIGKKLKYLDNIHGTTEFFEKYMTIDSNNSIRIRDSFYDCPL
ncbi:hypothetical protein PV328_003225 [Microctonus aethiopoides]|uniref:Uncharacterized protein n=1 Tax=Microctonus aethiopoides TaxID=144406 RepID=A0AA39F867_9HYME|nr:hypothetical protein PV328_003225 [Microctonus aethiopoides]